MLGTLVSIPMWVLTSSPPLDAPSSTKEFQEFEPPSYNEVINDTTPAPPYFDTTVIAPSYGYGDDGDVLVEGMVCARVVQCVYDVPVFHGYDTHHHYDKQPVGNFFAFFINLMVSMSFDFIGFLLTSLLSTSHAAKCGSRSGLGITLIRYGFLLKSKALPDQSFANGYTGDDYYNPSDLNSTDEAEIARENEWMSYILIVVGCFVLLVSRFILVAMVVVNQRLIYLRLTCSSPSL